MKEALLENVSGTLRVVNCPKTMKTIFFRKQLKDALKSFLITLSVTLTFEYDYDVKAPCKVRKGKVSKHKARQLK